MGRHKEKTLRITHQLSHDFDPTHPSPTPDTRYVCVCTVAATAYGMTWHTVDSRAQSQAVGLMNSTERSEETLKKNTQNNK